MRFITLIGISAIFFITACNSPEKEYSKDKYEQGSKSLAEIEQQSPARFLAVSSKIKKNLLGQTVIRGTLINHAKLVSYKDVEIKLSFYSKTGALLEEDQEVIYETIAPGASTSFKSKYFAARGTDSVAMKVLTAKSL